MYLRLIMLVALVVVLDAATIATVAASNFQIRMVQRKPDPHGSPRPAPGSVDVPIRTSIYFEIETPADQQGGGVDLDSVTVALRAEAGEPVDLLLTDRRFVGNHTGWLKPRDAVQGAGYRAARLVAVYIEPGKPLEPETRYRVQVSARSRDGAELTGIAGTWSFTTEAAARGLPVNFAIDLGAQPVHWKGRFFSGLCNVTFCSNADSYGPTYELMTQANRAHPRAWSNQRDFWLTGMDHRQPMMNALPNLVRERETRRIAKIEETDQGLLLRVEDFYGHRQYGIPSNRSVSEDYHSGDEVLIADGLSSAHATVLAADDMAGTVLISAVPTPQQGWQIEYQGPLPTVENPDAPGLFPPGGCYLRKFRPHGTACYYWGRVDKEFDLVHRRGGRRLMVNFADAAGDLSIDGRNWTTAKDLAQWHESVRDITGHLIDRYGDDSLDFAWSVFNEPDLSRLFWRTGDWEELQRFYDYTVDGILRAFEDRGYDSQKVFVGGLELGGIFGTNLRLREFLAHCSPRGEATGALAKNAAVADSRLDGKRSRRVEQLCLAHDGQGSPCDFVSIHAYNASEMMAAKLVRAKEMALEIDEEFFADLWINSHEACPEWNLPPDEAASDSYLGNGYFPTWCVDVASRQLRQAAADPRYGFGETLLTVWPPPQNFTGINAITRIVNVDDNGDGRGDRRVTIPNPVFHALTLLSDLGDDYWVFPEQKIGGHLVTGLASRDEQGTVRTVVYSHHAQDTQSRSAASFQVSLDLKGLDGQAQAEVTQYQFDRDHNSYFYQAKELAAQTPTTGNDDAEVLATLLQDLQGDDPKKQKTAMETLGRLSPPAVREALPAVYRLATETSDAGVRAAAENFLRATLSSGGAAEAYPVADVEAIEELAKLRPTAVSKLSAEADGTLRLTFDVAGNGLNFLVIEQDQ